MASLLRQRLALPRTGLKRLSRQCMTVLIALSMTLALPAAPAVAQQSCYGCNLVDEGTFNRALIGQQVFFRKDGSAIPVTVIDVDYATGRIHWRQDGGDHGWGYAVNYYTPARSRERDTAIGTAVVGGAAVLLGCLFGLCSGSNSSSSASSSSSSSRRSDCIRECRRRTDYNDDRSVAAGQDCIRSCERAY